MEAEFNKGCRGLGGGRSASQPALYRRCCRCALPFNSLSLLKSRCGTSRVAVCSSGACRRAIQHGGAGFSSGARRWEAIPWPNWATLDGMLVMSAILYDHVGPSHNSSGTGSKRRSPGPERFSCCPIPTRSLNRDRPYRRSSLPSAFRPPRPSGAACWASSDQVF